MNPQNSNQPAQVPQAPEQPHAERSLDYGQLLKEIGTQFKNRKADLSKRTGILLAPAIIGLGSLFLIGMVGKILDTSDSNASGIIGLLGLVPFLLLLVSPPWMIIISHLFKIERTIWIDAYFDGITISSKQSWKLAKNLFWPAFWLDLVVFLRYYLLPYFIAISVLVAYIYASVTDSIHFSLPILLLIIVLDIGFLWIYTFIMSLRLRYVRFLLIDLYPRADYSISKVLSDNSKLRKVMDSNEYKTLLASSLGLEAASELGNVIVGTASTGLRMLGDGGKAVGMMVDMVGGEAVAIAKDFSKQTVYYTYYRTARSMLYGKDSVNTELYSSAKINQAD